MSGVTLSNGSHSNIFGGQTLTVTNGITNNGTIAVDSDNNPYGYLNFIGSQTLSGTGSVVLGYYAELNTSNSGVLTQAAGHTISGDGQINAALINQGLVNANVNGQTLSLATNPMSNVGTMEATAGGVLGISTTVNYAGGTILATSGGIVQVGSGGVINGGTVLANGGIAQINDGIIINGTLTSTGTSNFQATGNGNLNGVTISNGSQFNIPGGATVTVTNGITNNGTIAVDSDNNPYAYLTFGGSQTLSGTGSVVLGTYGQLNTSNSGILTQVAGHTISGLGTINAALINQGVVNANVNGQTLFLIDTFVNGGTMEATGGGVLSVSATQGFTNSGLLDLGAPAVWSCKVSRARSRRLPARSNWAPAPRSRRAPYRSTAARSWPMAPPLPSRQTSFTTVPRPAPTMAFWQAPAIRSWWTILPRCWSSVGRATASAAARRSAPARWSWPALALSPRALR